ncbi:hypothetical protein AB9F29_08240 [Falsihalocynthiibacter sp. S25ZX9]|uniref:hypothetical protein n=1 Tax=unclassified Falsihalocynthiibacter TaxID=2854191 RepID=UPI00350EAEBF
MRKLFITTTIIAFSASMAMADQPAENVNNGAGGQAVKATNEALKAAGTNLGQWKKDVGLTGIGEIVSSINDDANHD